MSFDAKETLILRPDDMLKVFGDIKFDILTFSFKLYNLSKLFSKEEAYIPTILCRTEMIMKTMGR